MAAETSNSKKLVADPKDVTVAQKLVDKYNGQKSGPIRELSTLGWTQGKIARTLSAVFYPEGDKIVRPQHVSNVLKTVK
jgi:hypothetical protein